MFVNLLLLLKLSYTIINTTISQVIPINSVITCIYIFTMLAIITHGNLYYLVYIMVNKTYYYNSLF